MKMRIGGNSSWLGHVAFWTAASLVVLMGITLYQATVKAKQSAYLVNNSLWMLQTFANVSESMMEAKSAQREYVASRDDAFRVVRDKALTAASTRMDDLGRLVEGEPALEQPIASLRVAVARQRLSPTLDEAAMRDIAQQLNGLRHGETARLEDRRLEEQRGRDEAWRVLIAGVVLFGLVMIPAYVAFLVQSRARGLSDARLLDLANNLPGALFRMRCGPSGERRFEFLSRQIRDLRGIELQSAMKDAGLIASNILEEDRPRVMQILADATARVAPVEYECRVKRPDGRIRWIRTSANLSAEPGGDVIWHGHWSDVTDEKVLRAQLEEAKEAAEAADRAKSCFLATMSHEIRTPMHGVIGMLDLLSLTRLDGEQSATLDLVRSSGEALLRIIDDILDFSKIEAGKLEIRAETASVAAIVERVAGTYAGNAVARGLLLRHSVDPRIGAAHRFDPVRLQQILNNLVSNAIKFTAVGEIEIAAELAEITAVADVIRFRVRDTGPGIAQEDLQRLFVPFAQVNRGPHQVGTGLGLTICGRVAAIMGGTIEVETREGEGTTMTLTVPLTRTSGAIPPAAQAADRLRRSVAKRRAAPSVAEAAAEGTLLLVVDDHPINRSVLMRQVASLGYAAEPAADGIQALEKWKTGRFALVLTDCSMPGMSGFDLARAIRDVEGQAARRTPVIACTANVLDGEEDRFAAAGMDDHMYKPLQLSQLMSKLDRWLPLPESARMQEPPLDRSMLLEICGRDAGVERELIAEFRRTNENDMSLLRAAVSRGDLPQIVETSHRMKGASRTIGAFPMAAACERIEHAGRGGDRGAVLSTLSALEDELHSVTEFLDRQWQDHERGSAVRVPLKQR